MTTELEEILAQDDIRLFRHGACHVFALALLEELPDEHYSLCRMDVTKRDGRNEAVHIFAQRSDLLVDVGGVRRQADELAWWNTRTMNDPNWGVENPDAKVVSIVRDELFTPDPSIPTFRYGQQSRWRLSFDSEFVSEAMRRAKALISSSPDPYRASLV